MANIVCIFFEKQVQKLILALGGEFNLQENQEIELMPRCYSHYSMKHRKRDSIVSVQTQLRCVELTYVRQIKSCKEM